jgi:hypothetical protein
MAEVGFAKAFTAIHNIIDERHVNVYEFADNSRSKDSFLGLLADWSKQCIHSVCIQVEQKNHRIYHLAGLGENVKLLCEHICRINVMLLREV